MHWQRLLHLGHRWLGIVLAGLVLLWLLSGLVMLFVARPQLSEDERLAWLPALAPDSLQLTPLAAWQGLGREGWPEAVRFDAEPGFTVYRFFAEKRWWTVDAASGRLLPPLTGEAAAGRVVARVGGEVARIEPVERDQWTVYRRFDAWRPFYRVELADGRDWYVGRDSGEIVLDTAAGERAWNWLGSVSHWLYFTALRQLGEVWRQTVLWLAALALLLGLSGLWLGCQRLCLRRPYRDGRVSPYRDPAKRWHHLLGLAGGVFLCTWLFSGWLSLAPFGWAAGPDLRSEQQGLAGGRFDAAALAWRPILPAGSQSGEWRLLAGQPLVRLRGEFAGAVGEIVGDSAAGSVVARSVAAESVAEASAGLATVTVTGFAARSAGERASQAAGGTVGEGRAAGEKAASLLVDREQRLSPAVDSARLLAAAAELRPGVAFAASWLSEGDADYYPLRHHPRVFPVLRLSFADTASTRVYLDPASARLVHLASRDSAAQRWLYHGLHRLDFPPLAAWPGLRDGLVIALSLLGIGLVGYGSVLGWRRLRGRSVARAGVAGD
ncbi:hypothetical protein VX159_07420 [Dechloromonas sp. ZY10]|uniref:hypothetical protein n=1 Tax=Dechloromonas aquae TaxID=2664436 RepID=UPI0035293398